MLPLRKIRKAKGFTAKQLGDAIGTTEQSMSRIEREEQPFTLEAMRKCRDFLGVPISQLIGEEPTAPLDAATHGSERSASLALCRIVVEAASRYLLEERSALRPGDMGELIEELLDWALDNPDMINDGHIDPKRFAALIRKRLLKAGA